MILRHAPDGKVVAPSERYASNAHELETHNIAMVPVIEGGRGHGYEVVGEMQRLDKEAHRRRPMPYDEFLERLRQK